MSKIIGKVATRSALAQKVREASPVIVTEEKRQQPHLIVEARAGTGKTTTLIEALKLLKGGETKLTPSPQQQAVWDAIVTDTPATVSVCFAAFNTSIADELKKRVPAGCEAMTIHALGLKSIKAIYGPQNVNGDRVKFIICSLLGLDIRQAYRECPVVLNATKALVDLVRANLSETTEPALAELARHYEVDLDRSRNQIFDLVPKVIDRLKTVNGEIDFTDMIWLPVILDLPCKTYDLLMVDEAQDLNRCQQALVKKAGKRLVLCGDPKQAIYGFAGADAESMPRMAWELGAKVTCSNCGGTGRQPLPFNQKGSDPCGRCNGSEGCGCITLPLTVTRRCGKAIVREANKIVAEFSAFETNPEGTIEEAFYTNKNKNGDEIKGRVTYHAQVKAGDMILCRVNAPLVSQCFKFLKEGRKATIRGRDIGQGLISTITKLKVDNMTDLHAKLSDWLNKEVSAEQAKQLPNEGKIINLQDRYECLLCFMEGTSGRFNESDPTVESPMTPTDVIKKIEAVFVDTKDQTGIQLSSIHKAKGLEAKRVFLLRPENAGCPHPMAKSAWQIEQEWNLLYVAVTRAIEYLCYVG